MLDNLFAGMSEQRLLGAMLQGTNLARLGTSRKKRPQPTYRPHTPGRLTFTQEQLDRARASQNAADRILTTNSRGEIVLVEFPVN